MAAFVAPGEHKIGIFAVWHAGDFASTIAAVLLSGPPRSRSRTERQADTENACRRSPSDRIAQHKQGVLGPENGFHRRLYCRYQQIRPTSDQR